MKNQKKILAGLVSSVLMLSCFASCNNSDNGDNSTNSETISNSISSSDISSSESDSQEEESSEESSSKPDIEPLEGEGFLVDVMSAIVDKTDVDGDILIVEYKYTNNTDEEKSALDDTHIEVFQNGLQIEFDILHGIRDGEYDSERNEVQPGETAILHYEYILSDTSTPVELEIRDRDNDYAPVLMKTFDISDNSNVKISDTPEKNIVAKEGAEEFGVELLDIHRSTTFDGNPMIVIEYKFTNNSDIPESFSTAFWYEVKEKESSWELPREFSNREEMGNNRTGDVSIQPGYSYNVKMGYTIYDDTETINIKITDIAGNITYLEKDIKASDIK